jgi:6-pyruvoyltetrahydropterin/6-carboxytetrahydropterin synthase
VALTRIYHFSAAHRLESPYLSPEENARVYGQCYRVHGHNYYVEVTVTGTPDPVTGMAVDLSALDEIVERELLSRVDHRELEQAVPELAGVITTGESLARAFFALLAPRVPALARVAVVETAKNRFEYCGAEGGGPA